MRYRRYFEVTPTDRCASMKPWLHGTRSLSPKGRAADKFRSEGKRSFLKPKTSLFWRRRHLKITEQKERRTPDAKLIRPSKWLFSVR